MSEETIWVKFENGEAKYPPEDKNKLEGTLLHVNYWNVPSHLEEAGFEKKTQEEIDSYVSEFESNRTASFRNACEKFRSVCAQIQQYFGFENFAGGFDEMELLASNEKFLTMQGQALAQSWNAANQLCTYEAKKIGLDQPEWWYQCWSLTGSDSSETENSEG